MAKTTNLDFNARLLALRNEIAALRDERRRVEAAPLPRDEALARVPPLVAALAQRWTPAASALANPEAPSIEIIVPNATADVWLLTGLIAAVARAGMTAALVQAVEVIYLDIDAASCLPLAQRPARLQALSTQLFEAEVNEERLICEAEAAGVVLDRRGDANPAAVFAVIDAAAA